MYQNSKCTSLNETSSFSFKDDINRNMIATIENNQSQLSNSLNALSNDQDDVATVNNEEIDNNGWANFDAFERTENSKSEVNY